MFKLKSSISFLLILSAGNAIAQHHPQTDSLVKMMVEQNTLTGTMNQGTELVLENKMEQANIFFTNEIATDAGSREAYFNRGVVNWAMSNPENACRDWSSLLALGDTAAFKLLDKNCHGNMVIEDDTIPKKVYRQLFAQKKDAKTLSANSGALNVADQMPQFPGGDKEILSYFKNNIMSIKDAQPGTVYVSFIITKKGKVLYPYVTRGINASCDKEALRLVQSMPDWQPGKLKGKPVLVRYALPVRFSMK
jgi:hypothetical protein